MWRMHAGKRHVFLMILMYSLSFQMATGKGDYDYREEHAPYFLPSPTNVSFNRGDTAVLVCVVQHLGTKTVIWRRASDPNPLTIGSDVYVGDGRYSAESGPDEKEWRLVIRNVKSTDAGVYECQISSRSKLIHHVLLRVKGNRNSQHQNFVDFKKDQELPVVIKNPGIFVSGTKFVEKGDPIHLVCNSTGIADPPDNLDWFKDGIKLSPDGVRQLKIDKFRVRATRTLVSVLEVRHSKMEDAGTYVCRSSNLSITSTKVHVLNAGSTNVRRGTSATDKAEDTGNQQGPNDGQKKASRSSPNRGVQTNYLWLLTVVLCTLTCLINLPMAR